MKQRTKAIIEQFVCNCILRLNKHRKFVLCGIHKIFPFIYPDITLSIHLSQNNYSYDRFLKN